MNEKTHDPRLCDELAEDLVAFVDGELDGERAAAVREHLAACPACRALAEELGELSVAIRKLPQAEAAAPSPDFARKSVALIQKRAGQAQNASGEKGDPAAKPAAVVRPWIFRPGVMVALAASVFLVVLAVAFIGPMALKMGDQSANALAAGEEKAPRQYYAHKNLRGFGPGGQAGVASSADPRGFAPAPRDDPGERSGIRVWNTGKSRHSSPGGVVFKSPAPHAPAPQPLAPQGGDDGFEAAPPPVSAANKNAWYESNYQAGAGERARLEKLVAAGVVVDGQKVRLGAFTRSYHQDFPVPARRALGLDARLDHSRILTSGGEVFLQVGIQASRQEMSRRPPLNIALVIDRSGSMGEGRKMDAARRAALRFLSDLRPDDRALVIAYDDRVELARSGAEPAARDAMIRFVNRLRPRGATNIHGALDRAYRELAKRASPELINTVILLSDGLPTAGVTSSDAIVGLAQTAAEQGISTTTIGMGLDYNDSLMMNAARRGQGHYHFVRDASDVEAIFQAEFASLNRVVARALRLRIRLADDVVLRRVLGSHALSGAEKAQVRAEERHIDQRLYHELGIQADRQHDDEDGIRMMIPYFFSGDAHVVLLQLWVPPGHDKKRLAEVTLKYKDMLFARNGMDEREAVVGYTDDEDAVVASISRPVKKNLLGYRASEVLLEAASLVASGRERAAANMIDEQATLFREAARAWGDAQLARDGQLLSQYQQTILSLAAPGTTGREDLRAYLQKTLSHSAYKLTR